VRSLRALPKAHLHLHLEAGMRADTLRELAAGYGIAPPPLGEFTDFVAFEATYRAALDVLRTGDDLRRLVREVVEDAAAEGATYIEPALYVPDHRGRLGADEGVVEIVLDELARAGTAHGVAAGLMIAADRCRPPAEAVEQARLAARYAGRGVVSFGLAADERGHPPDPFAGAFRIARAAGLLSTPHAGELAGPDSVRAALDLLAPDRIQHGVAAMADADLVGRLADSGVCLDVCPSSNLALGVAARIEEHPLAELLAAGVRCTVNADDPLLFGTTLLREFELCRTGLGLDDAQLAGLARCSFTSSGAPAAVVAANRRAVDAWLAA
jgi:adenosine deaminase